MSMEENKAIVRRSLEQGFNARDLAIVDELAALDYLEHTPFPGQAPGPEGVKQLFTMLYSAFPDIQTRIDDVIAEGDKVVVRTTLHGTHSGHFRGIPPSGKQVTVSSMAVFRVIRGKIMERWAIQDQLSLLQQLGVV